MIKRQQTKINAPKKARQLSGFFRGVNLLIQDDEICTYRLNSHV